MLGLFILGIPGLFNSNWGKKVWGVIMAEEDSKGGVSATVASNPQLNKMAVELAVMSHSLGGPPSLHMLTQHKKKEHKWGPQQSDYTHIEDVH